MCYIKQNDANDDIFTQDTFLIFIYIPVWPKRAFLNLILYQTVITRIHFYRFTFLCINLKLACPKSGVFKEFVTQAVIKAIEDYELLDILPFKEAYVEENIDNAVPWEVVEKELDWEKQE